MPLDTRSPVSDTLNSQLQREKACTDRAQLEDQLKTQIKINAELRRLLVSTMGDDVQEHVRALSEDKAQLARSIGALLKYFAHESVAFLRALRSYGRQTRSQHR